MKLKMVIIGATGSGYKRTIPALKDSSFVTITAIQSRNEEKLKNICSEYNIPGYYTDAIKMLEEENFDLIYIANPPFLHKDTIQQCIKYNKPIICEKPLTRNYNEGLQVKKLLENKNIPFMIAHQIRHQKAYSDIKRIINSGRVGNVECVWGQWGFNLNVSAPSSKWKLNKKLSGGGTLSDNGIHVVDLMLSLFGEPENVIGSCRLNSFEETFSNETLFLIYKNKDIVINSSHTMLNPGNHLLIYGTLGKIEVLGGIGEKSIKKIIISSNTEEIIEYSEENLYRNEVEDFIKYYILNDNNVEKGTTLEEGLISLKLIDKARKNNLV